MTTTTAAGPAHVPRHVVYVGAAGIAVVLAVIAARSFTAQDLEVYREAGRAVLDGHNPYTRVFDGVPYTYTPFSTLVLVPLALLSHAVGTIVITLVSLACYWFVMGRFVEAAWPDWDVEKRTQATGLVCLALLATESVSQTLGFGQINFILMAVVIADVARRKPSSWQGVVVGLATAFKLIPGIFIVYFLCTRRYRAAATAAASFAGTIAIGWLAMPSASYSYWLKGVGTDPRHIGGSAYLINESILGLFARPMGYVAAKPYWIAAAIPTLLIGMWVARALHDRVGEIAGITAAAVIGELTSPISWNHHWTWFVVPALLVGAEAWRRRSALLTAAVVVWSLPFYVAPYRFAPESNWSADHHTWWESALGSVYAAWALAALVIAAVWLRRTGRSGAAHGDVVDDQAGQVVTAR
jgi:hypothetical protein